MLKFRIEFALGGLLVLGLAGCANFTSPARNHEIDPTKAYWLDYDASRRGALVYPSSALVKTCAEPSPDVALTLVSKLEAIFKPEAGGQVDTNGEFNATVVELAKRTQMVMFLRESLYRLCEQSMNGNIPSSEIPMLYDKILSAATDLAKADQSNAQAKAQEAERKVLEVKQQMQLK